MALRLYMCFASHSSQAQGSSSYTDELMFFIFANQSSTSKPDKEDLEKINQDDLEEMDLNGSQISAKVKNSRGYDSQFNEKEVLDIKEEEVIKTVFDKCSSYEENSVANDRFKKGKGYRAVPSPLTGNYMPPKPDLTFARLNDSIYQFKISKAVISLAKDEKDALETSIACVEKPKEDRSNAALIED
uniref:Uncharacterized protein n=1 Tax=Tanacetum cinerariifolium TaxID=118510 RepID=A0A699I738_TANCI|nr:hypothetical protein [Tanacetum cinerariifolium]